MIKQTLRPYLIVLSLALIASGSTFALGQDMFTTSNTNAVAMGDPGGGMPDPTGGNGSGPTVDRVALHSR